MCVSSVQLSTYVAPCTLRGWLLSTCSQLAIYIILMVLMCTCSYVAHASASCMTNVLGAGKCASCKYVRTGIYIYIYIL